MTTKWPEYQEQNEIIRMIRAFKIEVNRPDQITKLVPCYECYLNK